MKQPGEPDSLTVVNGPEDGAEYALVRDPSAVGQDGSCVVQVRLDRSVQPIHVRVSAVPDGYRIRCSTGAPAYVNGRRIGRARSRVMRHGDLLKVGNTELVLECAPDGLASRSRGISTDGDLAWMAKNALSLLFGAVWGALQWLGGVSVTLLRTPKFLIAVAVLGSLLLWPTARYWLIAVVRILIEDVRSLF